MHFLSDQLLGIVSIAGLESKATLAAYSEEKGSSSSLKSDIAARRDHGILKPRTLLNETSKPIPQSSAT